MQKNVCLVLTIRFVVMFLWLGKCHYFLTPTRLCLYPEAIMHAANVYYIFWDTIIVVLMQKYNSYALNIIWYKYGLLLTLSIAMIPPWRRSCSPCS